MRYHTNSSFTDHFREDHARYRWELGQLDRELLELDASGAETVPAGYVDHLLWMLERDVARHMDAEEQVVYARAVAPRFGDLVTTLKNEHELLRQGTKALRKVVDLEATASTYNGGVLLIARRVLTLLLSHLDREEEKLYPALEWQAWGPSFELPLEPHAARAPRTP